MALHRALLLLLGVSATCAQQDTSVKTFVIGLFKTGTTSMKASLEALGGHCGGADGSTAALKSCGFTQLPGLSQTDYFSPDIADLIMDQPEYPDLLSISDAATVFTDAPFLFLFKEMDERHPGSKFVLTLKDGGARAYVESEERMWAELGLLDRLAEERSLTTEAAATWAREQLASRYERHVASVRSYFKDRPDDLLELTLGRDSDVWFTLQQFTRLAGETPHLPFPNLDFRGKSKPAVAVPDSRLPSVSLIMPTAGRPEFVRQALVRISKQDYPNIKEVIIVEDGGGEHSLGELNADELPTGCPPVVVVSVDAATSVGAKRNIAASRSTGEIVAHWDDDDIFGPSRLREQIEPIVRDEADITLFRHAVTLFLDEALLVSSSGSRGHGPHFGTLVYRRRLWASTRFCDHCDVAEDYDFAERAVKENGARVKLLDQSETGTFVCTRHGSNTWTWRKEGAIRNGKSTTVAQLDAAAHLPAYELEFGHAMRESGVLASMQNRPRDGRPTVSATKDFSFFSEYFRDRDISRHGALWARKDSRRLTRWPDDSYAQVATYLRAHLLVLFGMP